MLFSWEDWPLLILFFWQLALRKDYSCILDCIFNTSLSNGWFDLQIMTFSWRVLIFDLKAVFLAIDSTQAYTHRSCIFIEALCQVEQLLFLWLWFFPTNHHIRLFLSFCLLLYVLVNLFHTQDLKATTEDASYFRTLLYIFSSGLRGALFLLDLWSPFFLLCIPSNAESPFWSLYQGFFWYSCYFPQTFWSDIY